MSHVARLAKRGLINPPPWMTSNMCFEGMTGSVSYGCNESNTSDIDMVGFCIPPKYVIFPHTAGFVLGFGDQPPAFNQFQAHHVEDKEKGRNYDVTIYGIVKFFELCRQNNPNMVDSLFVPTRCITFHSEVYTRVRECRRWFLHKGCWHKFRGYAHQQMAKLTRGAQKANPKRQEAIEKFGFDTKFAYHIVRLVLECEQILTTGDLILDRDREVYKSIRRGEWTIDRIKNWYDEKEIHLENLYHSSKLQSHPDNEKLKTLLIECLEIHYGSLTESLNDDSKYSRLLDDMQALVNKYK